ncbi:hypothetical protein, partial [Bacteroides heparinolyticus]
MMYRHSLHTPLLLLLLLFTTSCRSRTEQLFHPEQYVNPLIGTDWVGNTYPGASVPFGMVQLSPDNGK